MKNIILISVLFFAFSAYAQEQDFIVKNNGDTISCQIERVTDMYIHYRTKENEFWVSTRILILDVRDYQKQGKVKKSAFSTKAESRKKSEKKKSLAIAKNH